MEGYIRMDACAARQRGKGRLCVGGKVKSFERWGDEWV